MDEEKKGACMAISPHLLGRINEKSGQPKFLQIADRVRELIDSGALSLGDRLPSVNEVIAHFSVSRDTVVKAYQELKDRGIIESTPNKACFVSNVLLHEGAKKVLFLSDSMAPYKEQLYFGLIDSLTSGFYVDIVTHGDNFEILKGVYEKYKAMRDCSALLVIPTAAQNREEDYFKFVNPGNLLFLDRRLPSLRHPAVWQDFTDGFFHALSPHADLLKRYRRLVFLTKFYTNPIIEEMKEGLALFCGVEGIPFVHEHTLFTDRDIKGKLCPHKKDLYVVLDDHLLVSLMDACAQNSLVIGPDVGIIAINDGPFYSRLPVPISVLTTNFYAMGEAAAHFVINGCVPSAPIPTVLTVRASLLD